LAGFWRVSLWPSQVRSVSAYGTAASEPLSAKVQCLRQCYLCWPIRDQVNRLSLNSRGTSIVATVKCERGKIFFRSPVLANAFIARSNGVISRRFAMASAV
jgi:hypothetical protein